VKLLEVEFRNRIAPSVVQDLSIFPFKFDIDTGKALEEKDGLTDPNPGIVMNFLAVLCLLSSSSDLVDV
jgi:hypothetical protein